MSRYRTLLAATALVAVPLLASCGDDGGKAGPAGDFCTLARAFSQANDQTQTLFDGNPSPDEVKKAFDDVTKQIGALVSAAPSEIKADAQVLQRGLTQFVDAMKSIDYDMTKLFEDPSLFEQLQTIQSPEFESASQNVDNYLRNTCGIDTQS